MNDSTNFITSFTHNLSKCDWEPHPLYSVFTQYDGNSYYLPKKELFIKKYRSLFALAQTITPSKIIELGTAAGSSADAYLCGTRQGRKTIDFEYTGFDLFNGDNMWKPYEVTQMLFAARNFQNYKLLKIDLRQISRLDHADMVIVDAAHDYDNAYQDICLALTARPQWLFIDDFYGKEVAEAWSKIKDSSAHAFEWEYVIDYIGGGLIVKCVGNN